MIPHSVYPENGHIKEGPQGSSSSLLLVFMAEIDPEFGQQQFELYKKHFLRYRFGLPGIRAYPEFIHDKYNIDSGPVLLDIGGAASLVGQQAMACYGDSLHYHALRNSIEAFGMGSSWKKQKSYLFGLHPMADAFICWNNSTEQQAPIQENSNWRWTFQLLSILILILSLLILIKF